MPCRFFERIAALCKASSEVMLQLGEDAPLSVVCQLSGGGSVRMFLAPLIGDGGARAGDGGSACASGSGSGGGSEARCG